MNISSLISSVTNALDKTRVALSKIPGLFLIYTCTRRPGFSSILASAKVYSDMKYVENNDEIVKQFVFNVVNRIKMNIQDDGVCFVIIPPYELKAMLTGSNAGGPVVLEGSNLNYVFMWAIIR